VIPVSDDYHELPVTVYIVENAPLGEYTFNVYKDADLDEVILAQTLDNPRPDAILTFLIDDKLEIRSHLQSYLLRVGEEIGVVATMQAKAGSGYDTSLMGVATGTLEVTLPDGTNIDLPMHDDGVNGGDLTANDMVFSAKMKATLPGVYILESILNGEVNIADDSSADAFERTAQHLVAVSAATIDLASTATMKTIDAKRVEIDIAVTGAEATQPTLRAYTEVWGTSSTGALVPACWIGSIVEPANGVVSLELDLLWLSNAGVSGPLVLRNTYLSDMTTSFPISISKGDIPVGKSLALPRTWAFAPGTVNITKEMRSGVNPLPKLAEPYAANDLLMLPGYCTNDNPWSRNAAKFTNAFFPVDKGNYGNQQYSQKMLAQAEAQGMTKYSIVGHSQGGMVASHIYNFYWSGMDTAEASPTAAGKFLIQSLGTPYNGNTAAGSMANLGEVFGVGCGANPDLALDGAANWLTGISVSTRNQVHYFTTTYEQGNFFGDYCSLPMNLVLEWPNDGVTEFVNAKLKDAVNEGNTEKWCHSVDMWYTPQFDDNSRNALLNSQAAR